MRLRTIALISILALGLPGGPSLTEAQQAGKVYLIGFLTARPNASSNEGWFGRFFEVTGAGEVVWEYVNPYFSGPAHALLNQVFRAYRYSAQDIERARATGR